MPVTDLMWFFTLRGQFRRIVMVETIEKPEVKMSKKKAGFAPEDVISLVHRKFGKPEKHFKTDAHHIHKDTWRVNVWAEIDSDCIVVRKRITNSYFLVLSTDDNGLPAIVESRI